METDSITPFKVYGVSDLHTDHTKNVDIISEWRKEDFTPNDILLVAGDISSEIELIESTLIRLKRLFSNIFFVNGNNELRLTRKDSFQTSIEKFEAILKLCNRLNIKTKPERVNGVWIVPLFGWYSPYFDKKYEGDTSYTRGWLDFRACHWPESTMSSIESPESYFAEFTQSQMDKHFDKSSEDKSPVITFSHFLPRYELLPPFFMKKTLPLVSGSNEIEKQLRQINSNVHLCGHIHYNFDKTIDGVRYVQNALAHPKERKTLWNTIKGGDDYHPKLLLNVSPSNGKEEQSSDCVIS